MMFAYQEAAWGEFIVDGAGQDTVVAQLGDDYVAAVDDNGNVLVNGEVIYSVIAPPTIFCTLEGPPGIIISLPACIEILGVDNPPFQSVTYLDDNTICLGDVQKSAINNLKVIINSIAMEAFYGSDNVTLEPWAINMSMIDYMSATKSEVTLVNKTALEIAVDVANNVTEEPLVYKSAFVSSTLFTNERNAALSPLMKSNI